MAGLDYRDVNMVSRSLDGLTEMLLRQKLLDEQRQARTEAQGFQREQFDFTKDRAKAQDEATAQYRTGQLGIAQTRAKTAADKLAADQAGNVSAWVQNSDGMTIEYKGPAAGLEQARAAAAAAGKPWTAVQKPEKIPPVRISGETPNGTVTAYFDPQDAVPDPATGKSKMQLAVDQMGMAVAKTRQSSAPVTNDRAATELEEAAMAAELAGDNDKAQALKVRAEALRSNISRPQSFGTREIEDPDNPGVKTRVPLTKEEAERVRGTMKGGGATSPKAIWDPKTKTFSTPDGKPVGKGLTPEQKASLDGALNDEVPADQTTPAAPAADPLDIDATAQKILSNPGLSIAQKEQALREYYQRKLQKPQGLGDLYRSVVPSQAR